MAVVLGYWVELSVSKMCNINMIEFELKPTIDMEKQLKGIETTFKVDHWCTISKYE